LVAIVLGARFFLVPVPGAEILILLSLVAAFFVSVPSIGLWKHASVWSRSCLLSILGLVSLGQLVKNSEAMFPFVTWEMFSTVEYAPISAVHLKATLRDGREIEFHPGKEVRIVGESRIDVKIREQVLLLENSKSPQRTQTEVQHKRTLNALALMHNRRNASNPITAVSVYKSQALPPRSEGEFKPVLTYLWTVPVGDNT
jgi:hypothetical protein